LAAKADLHALYERAVQDPEVDADTLAKLYRKIRGREPEVLREDFCGTATLAAHWVKPGPHRRAVGIDLDKPTLEWGRRHNRAALSESAALRLELLQANVLDGRGPRADVTCALNFSYCIFKERRQLLEYCKAVRKRLRPDGIFVLDVLGGSEAMGQDENRHNLGEFVYVWEQAHFDPLTHDFLAYIHFEFPDGSRASRAYTYDWRLWTMPELCDVLLDAGFSATHRFWEKTDARGEGLGLFYEPKRVENQESWWTYLVAER
jgi:SAM-dependent methyltransferase